MLKNFKCRLISILLTISAIAFCIPATTAYATEDYGAGCWAYAYTTTQVYDNAERTVFNGKYVYASEGVTVLSVHNTSGGTVYKIQYSTTSGPKTGYVLWNQVCVDGNDTLVGVVNYNTTVYSTYSTSTSIGSVSNGEIVAILASNGTRYYIEYNVNSSQGRKRGYVSTSSISPQNMTKVGNLKIYWRSTVNTSSAYCSDNRPVYQIPNPNPMFYTWLYSGQFYEILSPDCLVNGLHFKMIRFVDNNASSTTYNNWITGYILP